MAEESSHVNRFSGYHTAMTTARHDGNHNIAYPSSVDALYEISRAVMSMTLVPVGPVMMRSPVCFKK